MREFIINISSEYGPLTFDIICDSISYFLFAKDLAYMHEKRERILHNIIWFYNR